MLKIKKKYKLSYIIPLYNKGEVDFQFRLNALKQSLSKMPKYVEVIIVEQVGTKKLLTYNELLNNFEFKLVTVKSDSFNKSWLYNVGVKHSSTNNIILSESDMDFKKSIFAKILNNIKPKTKWFFCYNRIIYYDEYGDVWLDRSPELHNTEGGLVFCDKQFYWDIGGMDENIVGMGGNDGHFIRRAEYITKDYPMLKATIYHRYHPYNSEKRYNDKINAIHKFNKEYYYKCAKEPLKMIKYLKSIIHYFGCSGSQYSRPFLFDNFDMTNKLQEKQVEINMIKSVNLSLSSLCSAKCMFCPYTERGANVKTKIMTFKTVKNIVDQITKDKVFFANLQKIEVGEAGDCFLNKDIIKILRYIRQELPHIKINMFTNFNGLDNEKSEIILKENLIDSIWMNIDSVIADKYYDCKQLELNKILKNLLYFFYYRTECRSKLILNVIVLPIDTYINSLKTNLNVEPNNILTNRSSAKERFKEIRDKIVDIIGPDDKIYNSSMIYWAERASFKDKHLDYNEYSCPQLVRTVKEIFIAPSGDSYLCCLDNRFDLLVGNVVKTSIKDVWFGKKREKLIAKLRSKQFKEIGYPCNTVNCCIHGN